MPQNMFPFTNADIWPNMGLIVIAGSSGTMRANAAFASSLGLGIFMPLGAAIVRILLHHVQELPATPRSGLMAAAMRSSDRDGVCFGKERFDPLERGLARVEDAYPVVRAIDRMGHEPVQGREVMVAVCRKERPVCLLADSDVEPEDTRPIQVG